MQKAQLGWHPASPAENPRANAARARVRSNQPPCATSQTDTLTLGAGPGAARGCSVCLLPGAFQQRWSRSGGDPKGSGQLPLFQGLRGGWREGDKGTLLGGGQVHGAGSDSRAGRKTCRTTGGWGTRGKVGAQAGMPPTQSHSPSSRASCISRRPSSNQIFIFSARGRGRGAGDRGSEARGQRRTRAGAPGEAAGEGRAPGTPQLEDSVSGGRTQILGESLGFFLKFSICVM